MPPRRHPLYDFNHDLRPEENSNERIPPPPPSSNDRTNPALTQLMAETTRQFTEVVAQISQLVVQFEQVGHSMCDIANQYFRMFKEMQEPLVAGVQPLHETPRCTCKQKARYTELSTPHEESHME
jgi:hypothetical protein